MLRLFRGPTRGNPRKMSGFSARLARKSLNLQGNHAADNAIFVRIIVIFEHI
jgi:hypothetical protein